MGIKTIIIEDEAASRLTLKNYLSEYCPQVELLAEAPNIKEGYDIIQKHQPQLVLLDIEMPFGNAFDLLDKFNEVPFETIFVTAFSNYALQAINLSSCSYLLKPVDIDELVEAVKKVEENLAQKNQFKTANILLENLSIENKQLKKIVLPTMEGFDVVQLKDVVHLQANDNLTDFHLLGGRRKTVCKTLKFFEEALSDFDFIRVHKSHVININYVDSYQKGKVGEIKLSNDNSVPLSASRKESFIKKFSL
jgi:two-component system LytT family response regulator